MLSPASFSPFHGVSIAVSPGVLQPDPQRNISSNPSSPDDPSESGGQVTDRVEISAAGRQRAAEKIAKDSDTKKVSGSGATDADEMELTQEELHSVDELKQRDREVRAHEQAHLANAGQYAGGGATFTYQTGPDGKRYAVGGEVPIDVSKERTPEQTIQKMEAIRRAAMAPASPSPADRRIAAAASKQEAEARQELQASTSQTQQTDSNEENVQGETSSVDMGKADSSSIGSPAGKSSLNGPNML